MNNFAEERLIVRIEQRSEDQKLGLKLLGGYLTRDDSLFGVFVRDVHDNSAAAESGLLQEGDLLLEAESDCLSNYRNESTIAAKLNKSFEANGVLDLVLARGDNLRCEFLNILAISVLERDELMHEESQRLYASQFNRSGPPMFAAPVAPSGGSLDAKSRLRVEKLEVALQYLGLDLTPRHQEKLRERLRVDPDGTTALGDFVQAVQQVMLQDPHALTAATPTAPRTERTSVEVERLRKEKATMQEALQEKEEACKALEEELLRLRRECATAVNESRALRKKMQHAELSQQQASCMEKDYQQVIAIMEAELAESKRQAETDQENPMNEQRLSVLGCQLRKAENSRKIFRAATDRLLAFTRTACASLSPESTDFTTKRLTPHQLGEESCVVLEDVRKLLKMDEDELGFAWEEAFTEDGDKYYINHITKKSQWNRPRGTPARPPSPLVDAK